MRKILFVAIGLALCGCTTPENLEREGYYVGANSVYAFEQIRNSDVPGLHIDDTPAFNARFGYRTGEHFSAEIQGEWLNGGFDAEVFNLDVGEITGWNVGINAKYYQPFGPVHPYAMLGAGYMVMDIEPGNIDEQSGTFWRVGGGIDFYVTENLYLNAESFYVLPNGDLNDFEYYVIGAGVGYRF